MNEEILNTIYSASLEFGENFHKSWLNSENVNRALSQGMYYAWRG